MGCGISQAQLPINMRINILDSDFMKKQNQKIRDKMQKLQIKYQTYISLQRMIINMQRQYCNVIITTDQILEQLVEELLKVNFFPNIFVKSNNNNKQKNRLQNCPLEIKYFKSNDELIEKLTNRTQNRTQNRTEQQINKNTPKNDSFVMLKILRQTSVMSESQIEIIKETLKSKNISCKIYHNFIEFQQSFKTTKTNFIVCDYLYHRQVLNYITDPFQTRVICFCSFNRKQSYDPRVYFLTDNWIQIFNQIQRQQKWSHLNLVKCSKVFLYSKNEKSLAQYTQILENFGFDVKISCSLQKIIGQSKHYFALSIVTSPSQREQVQLFLQNNDYSFKTKVITIQKILQPSIKSLRKIIKQLKRGYRAKKSTSRSIDIINKQFDHSKYVTVRQQFTKSNIICHIYKDIDDYIHSHKYMSPYVVINQQQSGLLVRYMRQIKSSSKVVVFCHHFSSMISQIKKDASFQFVSDHFGKIVYFVKTHPVYNPVIPDDVKCNDLSIIEQQKRQNDCENFDKFDPIEIQDEQTDLESYKIKRYVTKSKKSFR